MGEVRENSTWGMSSRIGRSYSAKKSGGRWHPWRREKHLKMYKDQNKRRWRRELEIYNFYSIRWEGATENFGEHSSLDPWSKDLDFSPVRDGEPPKGFKERSDILDRLHYSCAEDGFKSGALYLDLLTELNSISKYLNSSI